MGSTELQAGLNLIGFLRHFEKWPRYSRRITSEQVTGCLRLFRETKISFPNGMEF